VPEFSLEFAEKLAVVAGDVVADGIEAIDAQRTALYLSCLSAEIALKALLEKAGRPKALVEKRRHNLSSLLRDVCDCWITAEIAPGVLKQVPAFCLRGKTVDDGYANATIGTILDAETLNASAYPNQIRYGHELRQYPSEMWSKLAQALVAWARQHWDVITLMPIGAKESGSDQ
jgi:HEPN domain-containing protein